MKAAHALSSSFALVLALLVVGVPTQAQTVSGVVTNPSGAAVAGVAVSLRTADGDVEAEGASAGDGHFALTIPESGEYRIHADAAGHLPTVSLLFELRGEGVYQIDVEVSPVQSATWAQDFPRERYEDWGRSNINRWETRDVVIVSGAEWREVAGGRDLVEALEAADFPRVRIRREPDGFCARSGSSAKCMFVVRLTNGAQGRLRDVSPDQVEAAIYIGPTVSSGPTQMTMGWQESAVNASIILFMRGYLIDGE